MRKLILRMQTTVDALIEGPKGVDWIKRDDDEHWKDLFTELREADTFLLGRAMYPDYATHWRAVLAGTRPGTDGDLAFARHAEATAHVVVSRTMRSSDWKNTTFVGDLDAVGAMKNAPGKNILVWGGATLASALLDAGLLDECHLTVNPVVLGAGKPLFSKVTAKRELRLLATKPFSSGSVQLRYAVR